jgi:hypothetical protein
MSVDAAWYADPLKRFSGRFFDGVQWTDQVSQDGRLCTDPDWPPAASRAVDDEPPTTARVVDDEPPVASARSSTTVPERRVPGDRRQVDIARYQLPERRQGNRRKP